MVGKHHIFHSVIATLLIIVLSAWALPVEARSVSRSKFDTQTLDAYISRQMSKHGIKGISIAVTSQTEIVFLKGYGTAGMAAP